MLLLPSLSPTLPYRPPIVRTTFSAGHHSMSDPLSTSIDWGGLFFLNLVYSPAYNIKEMPLMSVEQQHMTSAGSPIRSVLFVRANEVM